MTMTEEAKKNAGERSSLRSLKETGLESLEYWILVAKEKFETEKFSKAMGKTPLMVASSKEADGGEYFATLNWHVDEDEDVDINLEYVAGKTAAHHDREPFAEQIMAWLGTFFKYETAQGHIHARFSYPAESKRSKFPLPLKTALDGAPEINGISLRLPTPSKGVVGVRLLRGPKDWSVEVIANRRIQFSEYSVYSDVETLLSVIDTFMEGNQQ